MRILIPVTTHYAEDFIQWLVKHIKSQILLSLDLRNLYPATMYQKKHKLFKAHDDSQKALDFTAAIQQGVSLITYRQVKDNWIIEVPQNNPYNGYFTTIYTLCKFVDSGCNELRGYPIFTKTFKGVAANVSKYYAQFLQEFVL